MWGLVIALLILANSAFILNQPLETAYVDSTGVLYQWYWFWTGISIGMSAIFVALFTFGGGAVAAFSRENALFKLAIVGGTMFLGGGMTLLGLLITTIKALLRVGGAYLLMTAGTPYQPFAEFDMKRLVIGGIMVLVAAIAFGGSSSSRSRSSDE